MADTDLDRALAEQIEKARRMSDIIEAMARQWEREHDDRRHDTAT